VYVEISGKRYPLFDDGKQVDGTRGDGVYGSRPLKVGEDTSFTVYAQYFSVTTKARATIRSTSNLFKLLSSVDNLFYQVFERRPSISEHAFWLERVRRGEKVTSLELLGAMQWHRLRGRTK
jgi:hypothetical protein